MMEKEVQRQAEDDPVPSGSTELYKEEMKDTTGPPIVENGPSSIDSLGDGSTALPEAGKPEHEYITGVKLYTVIASVTFVAFLMLLDTAIVATAIPRITSDFHSLSDVGWYGSAYLLANCSLQPLTGKIYTHFSSKYTFLSFLALFELGSALCGAAQSSNMLIIGRAVAGLGGSGLQNGALTILGAAVPIQKRPAVLGIMMSISQLGIVGGPTIGGVLTQYASWRWCFYINLPIGAVVAVFLSLIQIPDRRSKNTDDKPTLIAILRKLDLPGFCLFAPFAIQFILALEWGGTRYPWNSATIIGLFCGSGGTIAVFAAWEYRAGDGAMIPFSMVRSRIIWSSCLTVAFFFGSLLVFSYYLPIYFQAVKGVSPALSGVYILPGIFSQMFAAIVSGFLVGKLGYYIPWSASSATLTSVGAGLLSTLTPTSATGVWVGYQILSGFGRGCGLQMPVVAIQNHLPPQQNSVGMSLVAFSQTFAGSMFLTFAQIIFDHSLVSGLAKFAPTVNAETVIAAGATAFRSIIKADELEGVLLAYNQAVNRIFYLAAASASVTFVTCWGMGWKDIRKPKKVVAPEA